MIRLDGRVALVTGGGSGLGAAIARGLYAAGADVIVVGRTEAPLAALADELGDRCTWRRCDVSDPQQVAAMCSTIAERPVSILVNNAGIPGPVAPLVDIEPDAWDEVFAVNVRATYLLCRALLPGMIERGDGDIINLASVSGKRPLKDRTPYCASKMAVIGLTATLAFEVGPLGVRVNTLSPGPVAGPRMERNFRLAAERAGSTPADAEREFVGRAALGRMVTEDEVAAAALAMLAMPGMCGADVDLSGGMIA